MTEMRDNDSSSSTGGNDQAVSRWKIEEGGYYFFSYPSTEPSGQEESVLDGRFAFDAWAVIYEPEKSIALRRAARKGDSVFALSCARLFGSIEDLPVFSTTRKKK